MKAPILEPAPKSEGQEGVSEGWGVGGDGAGGV